MNFTNQKKRLETILKNPKNHLCADCNSVSPTWASLDFGVFLCSSCSGAHRALGPTITRVKSANLDLWEEDWYKNMVIGNEKLNKYWQSNPMFVTKKPKSGASNMQISRYVYQKYIKRKYVTDLDHPDPLTVYKNNNYTFPEEKQIKETVVQVQNKKAEVLSEKPLTKVKANIPNKKIQNLIDFGFESQTKQQDPIQPTKNLVCQPPISTQNNFSGRYSEIGTSFTTQTPKDNFITFNQLMKSQKNQENTLHHSLSTKQFTKSSMPDNNYYHPYNPNLAQHNLVYNSYFHPSSAHHYQLNSPHSHSPQPIANHLNPISYQYSHQNYIPVSHYATPATNTNSKWG